MAQPRRIYLLDSRHLSPETIAVAFAKTSRSPQSFDEIAADLSEEKSADFHEKWVVGYGHSSVAEHAVLHIAVENISRLAVECLESNRLASYTEKSSRYQIWGSDYFHIPEEFSGHQLENKFIELNNKLFEHYREAMDKVQSYLKQTQSKNDQETDRAFEQRLRSTAADACRYYLPASALANVGMTINARALEHAITKMLSHPLKEVNKIGEEIKGVSKECVPTLVKYADQNNYLGFFEGKYVPSFNQSKDPSSNQFDDWFKCVDCDKGGEDRILSALLYRFSHLPFTEAESHIRTLSSNQKEVLVNDLLGCLGEHDIPLRELEYASITFDILMDQGAYFEFKRHRMMTQTPQKLTALHSYAMPKLLEDAGFAEIFQQDMKEAQQLYSETLLVFPHAVSYLVPNAFNRRVLVKMNLRSALHFIKLRSAPNAHFAIRRVALRIQQEISEKFPLYAEYFKPQADESIETVERDYFTKLN